MDTPNGAELEEDTPLKIDMDTKIHGLENIFEAHFISTS